MVSFAYFHKVKNTFTSNGRLWNDLNEKRIEFIIQECLFTLFCDQVEKREKKKRKNDSDDEQSEGEEDEEEDESQPSQSQQRTAKT